MNNHFILRWFLASKRLLGNVRLLSLITRLLCCNKRLIMIHKYDRASLMFRVTRYNDPIRTYQAICWMARKLSTRLQFPFVWFYCIACLYWLHGFYQTICWSGTRAIKLPLHSHWRYLTAVAEARNQVNKARPCTSSYGESYNKDKTVARPCYVYNWDSCKSVCPIEYISSNMHRTK